jgi:hypothetical protein
MTSKAEFEAAYPALLQELLDELKTTFEMPPYAVRWIETVCFACESNPLKPDRRLGFLMIDTRT